MVYEEYALLALLIMLAKQDTCSNEHGVSPVSNASLRSRPIIIKFIVIIIIIIIMSLVSTYKTKNSRHYNVM